MSSREKVTGSCVRPVLDDSDTSAETRWGQTQVEEFRALRSSDSGGPGGCSAPSGSSSRPRDLDDIDELTGLLGGLSFTGSIEEAAVSNDVRPEVEVEDIETLESAIRSGQSQTPPAGISPLREFRSDRKEMTVTDLVGPAWYVVILFNLGGGLCSSLKGASSSILTACAKRWFSLCPNG